MDEMIAKENKRKLPKKVKRNVALSYLVKFKHNFQCQICKILGVKNKDEQSEAHHIVPLSKGGKDHSDNLIVLCRRHHREVHAGELKLKMVLKHSFDYRGS